MINVIFIDIGSVFFPTKTKILKKNNVDLLLKLNLHNKIESTNAEPIALHYFNTLNKKIDFEFVLLDSWVDPQIHKSEYFPQLLKGFNFHNSFSTNFFNQHNLTPMSSATLWLENNYVKNYAFIAEETNKFKVDFIESNIDYEKTTFVSKDNGLTLDNINSIDKTINKWN